MADVVIASLAQARSCETCSHFVVCEVRVDVRDALQGPGARGILPVTDHVTMGRVYSAVAEGCQQFLGQPEEDPR